MKETGLPDLSFYPANDEIAPIDYDVHSIPQHGDLPQHLHLDFRYLLLTRKPDALAPAAGESTRFRWLRFDEALAMGDAIDDSLKRLLRKGQARCRILQSDSRVVGLILIQLSLRDSRRFRVDNCDKCAKVGTRESRFV